MGECSGTIGGGEDGVCPAEHDEQERAERLAPLVAAYLAAKHGPCSFPEVKEVFWPLAFPSVHIRDALWQVMDDGNAILTKEHLVQAKPDLEIPPVVRLALETILVQRAIASLVAAGEKLLLCRRYHPVAEIIDLLEELEAPDAAQKLRGAMVRMGASNQRKWCRINQNVKTP